MDAMQKAELARRAIQKCWTFEALKYSDYLYGKEHLADDVWDLVEECHEIGMKAFDAKHGLAPSLP